MNDQVVILTGKDKGKKGLISKIYKKYNIKKKKYDCYVFIEGANLVNKTTKPNPNKNIPGGIVKKESKIDYSNIALMNPQNEKKSKIFYKFINKKKYRVFRSNGEVLN